MKVFKGLECFNYILSDKTKKLYSDDDSVMCFHDITNRICIVKDDSRTGGLVINDATMEEKWYSEPKKRALIRAYVHGILYIAEEHLFFDVDGNLDLICDSLGSIQSRNHRTDDVRVECDIFR